MGFFLFIKIWRFQHHTQIGFAYTTLYPFTLKCVAERYRMRDVIAAFFQCTLIYTISMKKIWSLKHTQFNLMPYRGTIFILFILSKIFHVHNLNYVYSLPADVVYTTITDSRYFIMSWPQQNILGKPRSGLCKYSLTPNLDTLASIRDFKDIKYCVRYLECTTGIVVFFLTTYFI